MLIPMQKTVLRFTYQHGNFMVLSEKFLSGTCVVQAVWSATIFVSLQQRLRKCKSLLEARSLDFCLSHLEINESRWLERTCRCQQKNIFRTDAGRMVDCSVFHYADAAPWCFSESKHIWKQISGCTAEYSLEGHLMCKHGISGASFFKLFWWRRVERKLNMSQQCVLAVKMASCTLVLCGTKSWSCFGADNSWGSLPTRDILWLSDSKSDIALINMFTRFTCFFYL